MIGISLQRCILLSACHTEEKRSEMIQLAQSPVLAIPSSVVEDKGLLFSILLKNREKSIPEVSALIYSMFFSSASNPSLAGKSPAPGQNPAFNQTGNKYLFISYSSKDVVVAEELRSLLEKAGIKCWIAPHSIPVGSDYTEVIVDAIEKSSGVVLLLSGNSQDSKWVPKELDIAISSEKVIFPIHIDRTEIIKKIYFRLTDSQVIEAGGNIESIFGELVDAVRALWNK